MNVLPQTASDARPARRMPVHGKLVEALRDMIVTGEIASGAKVPERTLCQRFGVSRTPLREALKALAAEGLVELQPNRGARVAALTARDVIETLAIVGNLEALAGELACKRLSEAELQEIRALHHQMLAHHARRDRLAYFRANQAIHQAIVQASGNAVLAQVYAALSGRIRRARYAANLNAARWDEAVGEHEAILAALAARDGPQLAALLRSHLANKGYALAGEPAHADD
jgi:DNA-binding GntR family transcriptional regulator